MLKNLTKKINKDVKQAGKSIEAGVKKAGKGIDNVAKATDQAIKVNISGPIRNSALVKATSKSITRKTRKTRGTVWNYFNKDLVPKVKNVTDRSTQALREQGRLFRRSLRSTESWYQDVTNKTSETMLQITNYGNNKADATDEEVDREVVSFVIIVYSTSTRKF
jgi:ribosome recycling factor